MRTLLTRAGGPVTAGDLGLPVEFYREAVCHAHEMRDRYTFSDLAASDLAAASGVLPALARAER